MSRGRLFTQRVRILFLREGRTISQRFDIGDKENVFIGEAKNLRISVVDAAGAPLNLTGKTLAWYLRAGNEGKVVLTKTGGQITLTNGNGVNDMAVIAIAPTDTVDGAGNVVIPARAYVHALKDITDEAVLSYGSFLLKLSASR